MTTMTFIVLSIIIMPILFLSTFQVQALENRLRQVPVATNSLSSQLSHSIDNGEGGIDNDDETDYVRDSLEDCRISTSQRSNRDTDVTSSSGGEEEERRKKSFSLIANGPSNGATNGASNGEAIDNHNDDDDRLETCSVADSFCDFQTADGSDLPNDDLPTHPSSLSHSSSLSAYPGFTPFPLHSSMGPSTMSASSAKSLKDLLSWEFDDDDRKADDDQPAILTPTVMR